MAYFEIKGVIPPMMTPFRETGDVDYDSHVNNVRKWNNDDLAGHLVLGSKQFTPSIFRVL